MDFFENQDRARRKTGRLITYFVLALVLVVLALYAVGMLVFNLSQQNDSSNQVIQAVYWNWEVLLGVFVLCVVIIGGGSLYRIMQLSSGGNVVAESLGGSLVDYSTARPDEKRLLNVVEEMAIASGVPVPPVYIIEDHTVNAFAAGYKPTDAVIGVTRGCIEQLNREQLQGVMAHEFSHIFNGDMRMNIKIIGVIHGLLVLGIIGWFLFRFIGPMSGGRRSSGSGKGGNAGAAMLAIMLFGLAMMLVGFIGTFFGRLIQAAVSRQREYLADASAVQYTRNPEGIGGALRVIGGLKEKTGMPHSASEYNHMFFMQAMDSIFATHPPIKERIARIEQVDVEDIGGPDRATAPAQASAAVAGASGFASGIATADVHKAVSAIGTVDPGSVSQAGRLIASIPPDVTAAAHDTWGARLLVLCLLMHGAGAEKKRQMEMLAPHLDEQHMKVLRHMHDEVRQLDQSHRLPLIDLSIPSLSRLSKSQYEDFIGLVSMVIKSDGTISLYEWVVHTTLEKHLKERYDPAAKKRPQTRGISSRMEDAAHILATLSYLGSDDRVSAAKAWKSGMSVLGVTRNMPPAEQCTLRELRGSLQKLTTVKYKDRRRFLEACEAVIDHDGQTTIEEAELMRAIADSIDCPMPPIMPSAA